MNARVRITGSPAASEASRVSLARIAQSWWPAGSLMIKRTFRAMAFSFLQANGNDGTKSKWCSRPFRIQEFRDQPRNTAPRLQRSRVMLWRASHSSMNVSGASKRLLIVYMTSMGARPHAGS